MLRQAAEKTSAIVGDGTTSTILAHAIFTDGIRNIVAGASAIDIKRGLDRAVKRAVAELKKNSRPVSEKREKEQVATISAHNDTQIGALVGDAMEKVGDDGVISVEESKSTETVDDAISATKAAVAKGILPGGGLALLRCIGAVEDEEKACEGDERTGVQVLKRALELPARQIAENSATDGGVVVAKMRRPGYRRHHRSDQSDPCSTRKCGFGRKRAAADRSHHDGTS